MIKTNKYPVFKNGLVMLELIFFAVIIATLLYFTSRFYFRKPPVDESTQKFLEDQGFNASSNQAVLENAKSRIEDINKQILDKEKQILDEIL